MILQKTGFKKSKRKRAELQISDELLRKISRQLNEKFVREERYKKYAPVKEVLTLLGKGALLAMVFMAPGTARAVKPLVYGRKDYNEWKKFNPSYLKRTIKSLERQKKVEIVEEKGRQVVKITENGKYRILKYVLEELEIKKPKFWDGKWRLILYDIPTFLKREQEYFRDTLSRLGFYPFQKSAFLFPYKCKDEIEYVRSLLGIREYVRILTVSQIENDSAFKTYFDLG